jgi:hypothetical protein
LASAAHKSIGGIHSIHKFEGGMPLYTRVCRLEVVS